MNRSLRSIDIVRNLNRFTNLNSIRTLYNEHLVHPRGEKTIHVEEDENQNFFACIHLEPTFPYEHTRPLPAVTEEIKVSDSVLKNEIQKDDIFSKQLSLAEVQRLTYTAQPFWRKSYLFKRTYNKKVLKPRDGI